MMKSASFCVVFLAYLCSRCCGQGIEDVCFSLINENTNQIKTLIQKSEESQMAMKIDMGHIQAKLNTLEASHAKISTKMDIFLASHAKISTKMDIFLELQKDTHAKLKFLRDDKIADHFRRIYCELHNVHHYHRNGSCYGISYDKATWADANQICLDKGGHLLVTETYDEFLFFKEKVTENTWVGLSDEETAGTYKWVDGTTLDLNSTALWWHDGEPSDNLNISGQNCIHYWMENGNAMYDDVQCNFAYKYICEVSYKDII